IDSLKITHVCAVSPILTAVAKERSYLERFDLRSVKKLITGADLLDPGVVRNIFDKIPDVKIVNGYGPTEATCVCTAFVFDRSFGSSDNAYPIGSPLEGIEIKILDSTGKPSTSSVKEGELLVSGEQLLSEYWKKPILTNSKLMHINGIRFYRTGDWVKLDKTGNLIFCGRLDDEIKISGVR